MKFCETHYRPYPEDDTGCWVCYEERKPPKVSKAKPKTELPKVSAKKAQRETKLAKVRQERKKRIKYCESCGVTGVPLSYSHIIPVKGNEELEDHPLNAILECYDCHHQYEHGGLSGKMKQNSWPHKLKVILELKPAYYNKLQLKN